MSDWALGKKLNSQIADVPLNHLIWLQDYKTYGEDSYVFQNKDILRELLSNYILSMNDPIILTDALNFALSNNEFSKAVQCYKKIGDPSVFNGLETFDDIVSERDALSTIFNDIILAKGLLSSSLFVSALYANPTNADAVLTSDVMQYLSTYKENIVSTISLEEPIFIVDVCANCVTKASNSGSTYFKVTANAGANYTLINGETVTVSTLNNSYVEGSYSSATNVISKEVNCFGSKIELTTATKSSSTVNVVTATATANANIVRLPISKQ
ncbi:MAG: hypothetical protein ACI4EE_10500 [Lachnospiraceae bacterium]